MTAPRIDHSNHFVLEAAFGGDAAPDELDVSHTHACADDVPGLHDRLGDDVRTGHQRAFHEDRRGFIVY